MMQTKTKVIIGVVVTGLVFSAGYFSKGKSTVTEIKEVIKVVTVKEEAKVKIVYRTIVKSPDGTETTTEHSQETTNTTENTQVDSSKTNKTETVRDSGLTLSALATVDAADIKGHRDYGIFVTKRVLGGLTVGAMATLDKKVGVSVGWSF